MKDEIKTFAEYKELVREYKESDSVSRRESIRDAVCDKAEALLKQLTALYAKHGRDYVDDSDFREDRGGLSLTNFDEEHVWLHYSDRWAYDGECDIGIEVQMKYLDHEEMSKLEKELHEERMSYVKRLIQKANATIEKLKNDVAELEAELEVEEKTK